MRTKAIFHLLCLLCRQNLSVIPNWAIDQPSKLHHVPRDKRPGVCHRQGQDHLGTSVAVSALEGKFRAIESFIDKALIQTHHRAPLLSSRASAVSCENIRVRAQRLGCPTDHVLSQTLYCDKITSSITIELDWALNCCEWVHGKWSYNMIKMQDNKREYSLLTPDSPCGLYISFASKKSFIWLISSPGQTDWT